MGISLGMVVESSVAVLLAVTIGYCVLLNSRLKRLHSDREAMGKMIGDLMQATNLANNAVQELKNAAGEVDGRIDRRLDEAAELEVELAAQLANGTQLLEKIVRITAAVKAPQVQAIAAEPIEAVVPAKPATPLEPQSRLHSALQQLAMRPLIGGKAA
jgi:polyhydroxyalkanoate synthesis regulator phasin